MKQFIATILLVFTVFTVFGQDGTEGEFNTISALWGFVIGWIVQILSDLRNSVVDLLKTIVERWMKNAEAKTLAKHGKKEEEDSAK